MNTCEHVSVHDLYCYTHFPSSAERIANFIVSVSNISFPVTSDELVPPAFIQCGQYQGYPGPGQTGTVTCSPIPSRGRYVFISLPTFDILTMCETRVFAGMTFTQVGGPKPGSVGGWAEAWECNEIAISKMWIKIKSHKITRNGYSWVTSLVNKVILMWCLYCNYLQIGWLVGWLVVVGWLVGWLVDWFGLKSFSRKVVYDNPDSNISEWVSERASEWASKRAGGRASERANERVSEFV